MENNETQTEQVVENADVTETQADMTINSEPAQSLTTEQEIGALRKVHQFLSEFDRVPGNMCAPWSQMLDTVAVVANSLIAKLKPSDSIPTENEVSN